MYPKVVVTWGGQEGFVAALLTGAEAAVVTQGCSKAVVTWGAQESFGAVLFTGVKAADVT